MVNLGMAVLKQFRDGKVCLEMLPVHPDEINRY